MQQTVRVAAAQAVSSDYGGKVISGGKVITGAEAMPGATPPRDAIGNSWVAADLTISVGNPPAPPVAGYSTAFLTRTPFGYVTPDGAARVIYPDSNANVIELYLTSDAASWQRGSLTTIVANNPPAPPVYGAPFGYVTPDGAARVVYADGNGDIIELYLTSDAASWQQDSLTALTGAPPTANPDIGAGSPFALTGPDGLPRVYYPDSNGHIIELRLDPDGWVYSDLTISVSNPPAPLAACLTGPPFAYVTPDGALHVLYTANLGEIIELYLTSDAASWQQDNLTALTQAPPAFAPPFAYVTPDQAARVVYPDEQGHIIELGLAPDGVWGQTDLTAITQAPPAQGAPSACVTPDGAARVVYPASNGDIIELYLTSDAASWQQLDLTGLTQAPPAGGAPSAYVTPDGAARVVYPDSNGDVIELRLQPGG